jgi:hypothetical protein
MMRIGVDGRKIPEAGKRGPIGSLKHGKQLGMAGLFFRTVLDMSPKLDSAELKDIRDCADDLGMYLETGLGKVNPYATPEAPELRAIGNGDILAGFRRMMEACAAIGCRELWVATANYKPTYRGRLAYDRFRTDVTWPEQLAATERFLLKLAPIARDLGIHMNIETHEEITSFELVHLVESVGPMQRASSSTRPMFCNEASIRSLPRGASPPMSAKPTSRMRSSRSATVASTSKCEPAARAWSISGRSCRSSPRPTRSSTCRSKIRNQREIAPRPIPSCGSRSSIPSGSPAIPSIEEYAAYIELVLAYDKKIADGAVPSARAFAALPFGYEECVALIKNSAAHLRKVCGEFGLPLEADAS